MATRPTAAAAAIGGLAVAALLRWAVGLRRLAVEGASMAPALRPGDRLLLVRRRSPRPGDVVAFHHPRHPGMVALKRVAAAEGGWLRLLGDDPAASTDSRDFGPVAATTVLGRAVYRYAPRERRGRVPQGTPTLR